LKKIDFELVKVGLFCSFFTLACSCMLGPKGDIAPPELSVSFDQQTALLEAEEPALTWWQSFNDPILNQLMQEAFCGNFDIRLASEKVNELRANYRMESADLWPSVNAYAEALRLRKPQNILGLPAVAPAVQNLYILGFDASWELDIFGKTLSARRSAYFEVLSAEEKIKSMQVTVAAELARLYTEMRTLQQRIKVIQHLIGTQKKIVSLTENVTDAGIDSNVAYEEEKALLASNQSLLPELEKSLKQVIYNMAFLLGKNKATFLQFVEKVGPIPSAKGKVTVGIPSTLLRRRPDIAVAEKNYYSACAKVGQARADLFPSFSLTASIDTISDQARNLFTSPAKTWVIWPAVNWNIFQGWKTLANIKVQNSKQKQAFIEYEKVVSLALNDVEGSLAGYAQESFNLKNYELQFKAKKNIVSLYGALLQSGIKRKQELLKVKKDLYQAQDAYLQSRRRSMLALITLYKALGGGWQKNEETEVKK
jgi:multidrug efflux system outer membrane protein